MQTKVRRILTGLFVIGTLLGLAMAQGGGGQGRGGGRGPAVPPILLFAVDTKVDVPQATPQQAADTRTAIMKTIDGHILGKAVLVGRFHQ